MLSNKQEQLDIAESLQLKLLKRFNTLLDDGSLSPTDAATLARLLMQNGWTIDPAAIPKGLRDKLQLTHDPHEFDDEDERPLFKLA